MAGYLVDAVSGKRVYPIVSAQPVVNTVSGKHWVIWRVREADAEVSTYGANPEDTHTLMAYASKVRVEGDVPLEPGLIKGIRPKKRRAHFELA